MTYRLARRTVLLLPLLCTAALRSGAAAGSPQAGKTAGAALNAASLVNACTLLTSAELQAAVGEPLAEAQPSAQAAGKIRTSQCLFRTPTFAKSVSLTITMPGAGMAASSLREFWRNQFHTPRDREEEAAGEREDAPSASEAALEREARKPRAVPKLGDEAFWVGSPISGALYVLHGNAFLRVSVGGIADESSRLAKSEIAAKAAIARLNSILADNPSSPRLP